MALNYIVHVLSFGVLLVLLLISLLIGSYVNHVWKLHVTPILNERRENKLLAKLKQANATEMKRRRKEEEKEADEQRLGSDGQLNDVKVISRKDRRKEQKEKQQDWCHTLTTINSESQHSQLTGISGKTANTILEFGKIDEMKSSSDSVSDTHSMNAPPTSATHNRFAGNYRNDGFPVNSSLGASPSTSADVMLTSAQVQVHGNVNNNFHDDNNNNSNINGGESESVSDNNGNYIQNSNLLNHHSPEKERVLVNGSPRALQNGGADAKMMDFSRKGKALKSGKFVSKGNKTKHAGNLSRNQDWSRL